MALSRSHTKANRKQPDNYALSKLRAVIEAEGLVLLDAAENVGEGVRWSNPSGKRWVDCLRHGRAMLGATLDQLATKSGVGRYVINRIECGEDLPRTPEESALRLRETLFENGVIVLDEEENLGAGVRFRFGLRRKSQVE